MSLSIKAQLGIDTFYINHGNLIFEEDTFSILSLNQTENFKTRSSFIASRNELEMKVLINNNPFPVQFENQFIDTIELASFDTVSIHFSSDPILQALNFNSGDSLRGHSLFAFSDRALNYYWILNEHDKDQDSLWNPEWFSINGQIKDSLINNEDATIEGKVGDTILLFIYNAGQSDHSIHFHGYHQEWIWTSKHKHHIGRSKDTHPIERGERLVLQIVPDKPGLFPVHDHNLIATTGGGKHSNGMFIMMKIEE